MSILEPNKDSEAVEFKNAQDIHEMSMSNDHVEAAFGRLLKSIAGGFEDWFTKEAQRTPDQPDVIMSAFLCYSASTIASLIDALIKEERRQEATKTIAEALSKAVIEAIESRHKEDDDTKK